MHVCMCCSRAPSMPPGQNKKETISSKDVFSIDKDGFHICSAVAIQSAMWWVSMWRLTWDFDAVLVEW